MEEQVLREDFPFKTRPYRHQLEAFHLSRDRKAFALLMEMRTGKSKVVLDTAGWLYQRGEISGVLVIAPNGVHRMWIEEQVAEHFTTHLPIVTHAWRSGSRTSDVALRKKFTEERDSLAFLTMNYEAILTKDGKKMAWDFLGSRPCLLVLDESHRIKTPSAKRTRAIGHLGRRAAYRRILTGTPVTVSPLDVYTQYQFLSEDILQSGSFYAFRNRYAIVQKAYGRGREFMEVVGYRDLDELKKRTDPHSFRVTAAECLDLPPRQYLKLSVELSPHQSRIYNEVKTNIISEVESHVISVPHAITRLLRLQQIVGGFYQPDEGPLLTIDDKSPRLEAMLSYLEDVPGKVIVWARFRAELAMIEKALVKTYGRAAVGAYHGGTSATERVEVVASFRVGSIRYLVAQPETAGEGLDLSVADTMIYFSNSFKLTARLQSEARCDHPTRTTPITVVDLFAPNTTDARVVQSLRDKRDLAATFTGDELRSWL